MADIFHAAMMIRRAPLFSLLFTAFFDDVVARAAAVAFSESWLRRATPPQISALCWLYAATLRPLVWYGIERIIKMPRLIVFFYDDR